MSLNFGVPSVGAAAAAAAAGGGALQTWASTDGAVVSNTAAAMT
jgi:hypothetical protein